MRTEQEIRERLIKTMLLENTPIDHLRVQRYHEIEILKWVLNDSLSQEETKERKVI